MAKQGTGKDGGEPGGGEPDSRLMGDPEPGSPPRGKRVGGGRGRRGAGRPPGRRYSPEERRHLLETYAKSGMKAQAFCATVGMSTKTLYLWLRREREEGPKGLEPRKLGRPKGSGAGSRLPEVVQEEVRETKRRFPFFGLKRLGAFLRRFRGIAVDPRSVGKVLREADPPLPVGEPARRKPRRHPRVRRFEKSRPGQLWQTDITSYVLARHRVRVYLVAFVDDHSRYVVSWALGTTQKKEWVAACLLDGVAKYGKPETVLSDQGPQYYAWRGKSAFQKLLAREGIQHSVARSHHPQTLGKCERLWQSVGKELWERAHPQELEEARERLKHYFAFYNFFRPHQGIGDSTPADRFFGAEEAVRRMTEARVERNALQLALGERPRRGLFVVGQVGERAFSMHGEKGGVVFQTDEGVREALGLEDLGMPKSKEEESDDGTDGGDGDGGAGGGAGDGRAPGGAGGEGPTDAAAAAAPRAPAGGGGAGAVGGGDGGGAEEGARGGGGDPRVVARSGAEGGGAGAAAGDAAAAVADVADGALGDGGGAPEAAEEEGEGAAGDSRGGEPGGAEEEGGPAGAGPLPCAGAGGSAPDASLVEEGCDPTRCLSRTGSGSGRSSGPEGTQDAGSGPCSPGGTR